MKIKLVAIGAEDIVDNNIKYILGLLWSIFRKLRDVQLGVSEESGASDEQQALLQWVRKMTEGYEGVEIKGFKDSWSDGLALCALCHRFDSNLIDYDSLKKENKEHNVKLAFEQAEKHIGIPSLLDVDEVVKGTPDERSAVFYISLFFHAFVANEEKLKILETQKKAVSSISELRSQLEIEQSANKELKSKFHLLEEESSKEKELRHKLEAQLSEEQKLRLKLEHDLEEKLQQLKLQELSQKANQLSLEEELQKLSLMLETEEREGKEASLKLKAELEAAAKAREELEAYKKKLEANGSNLLSQLQESEEIKKRLLSELEDLKKKIKQEMERRKKKTKAAVELEKENEALKRQAIVQGKARSGLEVLKRNLEEHIEDLFKWRELHSEGEDQKEEFNLDKVLAELAQKTFEEQLDNLNAKLQSENRNLQRIIRLKDAQHELRETVDKQGWLEMKGAAKQKEWKKQWFVLRGSQLTYYKSEDADRSAGSVPLAEAELQSVKAEDERQFLIGLKVQDRNIVLSATSKKERDAWRAVINGQLTHLKYLSALEKSPSKRPDTRLVNLFKSPKVTSVYLDGHDLKAEEMQALTSALTVHRDIDTISLVKAGLTDAEIKVLASNLKDVSFRVLKLGQNQITSAGVTSLLKALEKNEDLVEIHFNDNKIDDAGVEALVSLLNAKGSKLAVVNLSGNEIGDKGAAVFAESIGKSSATISNIQLAENNIGDAGADALAQLIKKKQTVVHVNLSGNNIGDAGAAALASSLSVSESISELDLSDNEIGNKGAVSLRSTIKASHVNTVNLSKNKRITGGDELSGLLGDGFVFPALSFSRQNN